MAPFFGMLTSKMEESLSNLNATLACPLPLCVLSLEEKGAKLSSVGDFHDIRNLYMGVWVVVGPATLHRRVRIPWSTAELDHGQNLARSWQKHNSSSVEVG